MPTIGQRIKACREPLGISQNELAKRAGISRRSIERIEVDAAHHPRVDTLKRILVALGVPESRWGEWVEAANP